MEESVMGEEDAAGDGNIDCQYPKKFWRSASWSSSRSARLTLEPVNCGSIHSSGQVAERTSTTLQGPCIPLTPRSQQSIKARSCLPPLQPLSITRRCLEEWPEAGSDDIGEWPYCTTPRGKRDAGKLLNGPDITIDLGSVQRNVEPTELKLKRDKIAFFDKECSRVAEHVYLGSDAVAKNREVLRQNGITHVLNCVGFVCPEYFKPDLVYKTLWLQDSPCEDITSILYDVFDYFEEVREQGGRVFVHCCQGVSRSTSLVIAYLMWRKGQSFEDAFQYVKAARGITNPNIGFASQLSQCQKRVHAAPMSPSSLLRMYRMAPHSSYAPLHLVPKSVNPPGSDALDSRGAFIVQIPSAIYVWIGNSCDPVMERMAEAAALQVVKYERAQGAIVLIKEGHENSEFLDALSKAPHLVDDHDKSESNTSEDNLEGFCSGKDQVDTVHGVGVGDKRVESYNIDFELFGRAIAGGVVPPFSFSGTEIETHLPARETGWGKLRRKFVSGSVKELVTASKTIGETSAPELDAQNDDTASHGYRELLSPGPIKPSISPCLSPMSIFSVSRINSKSPSPSPSPFPSPSSLSFTLSPSSSVWSPFSSSQSPSPVSNLWEPSVRTITPSEIIAKPVSFPSKGPQFSLAQRRGNNSPSLDIPTLIKVSSGIRIGPWICSDTPQEKDNKAVGSDFRFKVFDEISHDLNEEKQEKNLEDNHPTQNKDVWHDEQYNGQKEFQNSTKQTSLPEKYFCDASSEYGSSCITRWEKENAHKRTSPVLYKLPNMEMFNVFNANDLDHRARFILLAPRKACDDLKSSTVLYLWVGSDLVLDSSLGRTLTIERDWERVGHDFLKQMGLPLDIPIRIVRDGEEPEEFWGHFSNC
ncbi:protein-tyrosine-phosphatase MKP1 [Cryptomeria japonica]|uniref:protein-tyrosine-phosphatase MKP1 n=1 Tax=Cryptomeria japonica TaxID=3369 RepID=UPI0025ABA595|nr:protein-tyrosine-phosphatase MKP1 [Cryptomeria japonica]XP_059076621.1 protein-tyrosine-phosphatase MKP1 [Cryptomeria japonica]XP_059076625.1 protein-tyrosine-phosphatase MKP1 [Cryptomeria japonica]XP_059076628.1 protein-tyrosine-phosphatase MKP1 [Cryptomeria japonica]XP_059076632.1 protein-tyrosine-phosphatase MKP1 [Cryptomeria japonica]XP_059076634.1 protein-tyrosine-phosphatase MKP1 [Cryptomeria japonica]